MAILAPDRREKLAKVCGLLASDVDGERSAAAWQASRILKDTGLTWAEFVAGPSPTADEAFHRQRTDQRPQYTDRPWYQDAQFCKRNSADLTTWEREFIGSIVGRTAITHKQRKVLVSIKTRLCEWGRK